MPSSQTTEAGCPAEENDLLQRTILGLLRACDVVFGATTVGLALLGVWMWWAGQLRDTTVAGLSAIPLFNSSGSGLTRNRDRKGTTFTIRLAIDGGRAASANAN